MTVTKDRRSIMTLDMYDWKLLGGGFTVLSIGIESSQKLLNIHIGCFGLEVCFWKPKYLLTLCKITADGIKEISFIKLSNR